MQGNFNIDNYPTNFYVLNITDNSTLYSDSKITVSGKATYTWDSTVWEPGAYRLKCNITDNATLYYDAAIP